MAVLLDYSLLQIRPDHQKVERLVVESQKGNAESFGELYDIFIDGIYRYMFFRVGEHEAEDLTELVFLKAWENIRQYKSSNSGFSSWIYRIAHNLVIDYYRLYKHRTEELSENVVDHRLEAQTMERAHRSLNNGIVTSSLMQLPSDYRQILVLKFVEDLSYGEIGEIMGRTQAALRILQLRALRKLKQLLDERGITDL